MKVSDVIKRDLCYVLFALSLVSAAVSLFIKSSSLDTAGIAKHISYRTQHRLDRLDAYADQLLEAEDGGEGWTRLKGFPDDMVLYKYVGGELGSWYNLFSISNDDISDISLYQRISTTRQSLSSPLALASSRPSYMNLGPNWYVLKMKEAGNVKVIEGLLIKNTLEENVAKGQNGINSHIHIHGKYDVASLSSDEGSPVFVDDIPVFKVVVAQGITSAIPKSVSYLLRWLALFLMTAALVLYLAWHRTPLRCASVIVLLVCLAFLGRMWGMQLTEYSSVFNPVLYAHDGLLNSFGTLMIFNIMIFLSAFCIFLCRREIAGAVEDRKPARAAIVSLASFIAVGIALYIFFTFCSLIRNSGIATELYRFNSLSWHTLAVHISYALLCVSFMLCTESVLVISGAGAKNGRITLLTTRALLLFSISASLVIGITSAAVGFRKEEARVMGWSNRLAVDRDLGMELELRSVEGAIDVDPVIKALTHIDNGDALLLHRLEEMYLRRLSRNYDIAVGVRKGGDPSLRSLMSSLVADGSPIGPDSHFLYNYNPVSGSHYTGAFNFYDENSGLAVLLVGITPKSDDENGTSGVHLPPFYSYAKYSDGRLVSFSGNYAYPTVENGLLYGDIGDRRTFNRNGYRHFFNRISSDETIVISRRERGAMIYFVSITFLVLLIFLVCLPFRRRSVNEDSGPNYFSSRMRRLIELSLIITLLLMSSVSVLFVYQRNERNLENILSGRISAIQHMLDGASRTMLSSDEMLDRRFFDKIQEIGRNTGSVISLYALDGHLIVSTAPDAAERRYAGFRIDPEAFCSIMFDHSRYCIHRNNVGGRIVPILFAPVMGASGEMIAIASTPYMERDYDFMRDVVYHAASIVSLFLILLFITLFVASSMTESIFHPLLAMSQKMRGSDAYNLEQIDYEGDDEISALVNSYNNMVVDLKESTAQLASAERDKAWSQMARQVAHEIKNPLTPIKLEVQRLVRLKQKNDPSWEEKFDRVSEVVLEHIDILTQTANEFSTFAKLYTEEPVEMDLDHVLRDQILLFSEHDVDITYLGMENAVVTGPKPQIIRVIVNLLTNAVQAVGQADSPKVMVSLRRGAKASTWDMVFEDNGPGVDADNIDKLFTPNFTTKSSGTGLGLAICRSIVDKCGGTIVYSRSFTLGGACFTVTLPK